jgi:hypothetical protein
MTPTRLLSIRGRDEMPHGTAGSICTWYDKVLYMCIVHVVVVEDRVMLSSCSLRELLERLAAFTFRTCRRLVFTLMCTRTSCSLVKRECVDPLPSIYLTQLQVCYLLFVLTPDHVPTSSTQNVEKSGCPQHDLALGYRPPFRPCSFVQSFLLFCTLL